MIMDTTPSIVNRSPLQGLSGPRGVWTLAVAIGVAAVAMGVPLVGDERMPGGLKVPWWSLVVAFALAEVFVVHLNFGRNTVSFSLSEIPITLTFGALSPLAAVVTRLAGSFVGLGVRRVRGVKLVFNLASAALETVAATIVYRQVLAGESPLTPRGWLAALVALLVVDLVSGVTIFAAMSLTEGRFDKLAAPEIAISGLIAATTNTCLAVITLIVLDHDPYAGIALVVVAGVVLLAYRAWAIQARRHSRTQLLYNFVRALDDEIDIDGIVHIALTEAKRVTGGSGAEVVMLGSGDVVDRRCWVDEDGGLRSAPVALGDRGWWTVLGTDARRVPIGRGDAAGRRQLQCLGFKDAIVASMTSSGTCHGAILVTDRADEVSTFGADDLQLLETLASHVAVELDNAQLVVQLRTEAADKAHQSLHDALTGLPNRRSFAEKVFEAINGGQPVAVLLMDLDRFKEINDTLGHAAGDRVLSDVADRLRAALDDDAVIARFGGDEFAVLLNVDKPEAVFAAAHRLLAALQTPVTLDHFAVDLGASIGAALAPAHGTVPDMLIQHADVAMYLAKDHQTGVELYSPERDVNDVRRLSLLVELRRAVKAGELYVEYQPLIDVATNKIGGAEALVRWTSDQFGPIGPDEFIPIAECAGLIGPLTEFVLARALDECAAWRATGWDGGVSVNLSARSLLDQQLPDMVADRLFTSGVPAEALTLEITETNIMRDPDRNVDILRRLDALGVRLSIDDFGIGYSSLSYLKRLPVKEVKIDRSFVARMELDEGDKAIVHATIRLGHDLGLSVVAEGIETAGSLRLLTDWGVDVAQGYLLGRPTSADAIMERLTRPVLSLVGAPARPIARAASG